MTSGFDSHPISNYCLHSSVVEHLTVNQSVVGSIPSEGALLILKPTKMEFRRESGEVIGDLKGYIEGVLEKYPDAKIHIGTDSQRKKRKWIAFATVIAFRYGTRGVHFIYAFERKKMFETLHERLMHEVTLTVEIVTWLYENMKGIKVEALEADVNEDKKWKSHKSYSACVGYLIGVSQVVSAQVLAKPDLLVAIRAANNICNS